MVDTQGLVLEAVVHEGNVQDQDGAKQVLKVLSEKYPHLRHLWADGKYAGQLIEWVAALRPAAEEKVVLEIVRKAKDQQGFVVLPRRWVIERTFAWLGRYRRLSKDYEELPETSRSVILVAMIHLMVRRLQPT
jgi:putative transposase